MRTLKSAVFVGCAAAALGAIAGPWLAWAGGPHDDRTAAETSLGALQASPRAKAATQDHVRKAKDALERARRMRAAGDDVHARLAEAVALEWTRAAEDTVRATEAEEKAARARLDAMDAGAFAERERALLEQQLAENGRMKAELRAIEDAGTSRSDGTRRDGGAAKGLPSPRDGGATKAKAHAIPDAGARP